MKQDISFKPPYFDALYAADNDPWRFASSAYESEKYTRTLAAIPTERIGSALEVGCSIGVLTRKLADRCDALLAVDIADAALTQAKLRCASCDHVSIQKMHVPIEWPDVRFNLILFSEVLYYMSRDDIEKTSILARNSLEDHGIILLVHYVRPTNYPNSGDNAVEIFISTTHFRPRYHYRTVDYRLDLLEF